MELTAIDGKVYSFIQVELQINTKGGIENIFKNYHAKTIEELSKVREYKTVVCKNLFGTEKFQANSQKFAGQYLGELKDKGDKAYLTMLNKHGDREYCDFEAINMNDLSDSVGIICITRDIKGEEETPAFIGQTKNSFSNWLGHAGSTSPAYCYKNGQSTFLKINANMTSELKEGRELLFWICEQDTIKEELFKKLKLTGLSGTTLNNKVKAELGKALGIIKNTLKEAYNDELQNGLN